MLFGKSRFSAILSLCFTTLLCSVAQASTWVPIDNILVPVPQLDGVVADKFEYGPQAKLELPGFGATSSIYYQVHTYTGAGVYQTGNWQCHNQATLTANNQTLSFDLIPGRYKVSAVAVIASETCDLTAFQAGELLNSETYTSEEFIQLDQTALTIVRDPALDGNGNPANYSLQLRWPVIKDVDNYQLTLYKDNIPHRFTVNNADLQADGHYLIADTFDISKWRFPAFTGYGEYRFDLKVCDQEQCSNSLSNGQNLALAQLLPWYFEAQSRFSQSYLPDGMVRLYWKADIRHTKFRFIEHHVRNSTYATYDLIDANGTFLVDENTGQTIMSYDLPKPQGGDFVYYVQSCDDTCTNDYGDGLRMLNIGGITYTDVDALPGAFEGFFDAYNPATGDDTLTGYAIDMNAQTAADGTTGQTNVMLKANGQIVEINGKQYQHATLASSSSHSNNGFAYNNMTARLSGIEGIDFNQPILLELFALNVEGTNESIYSEPQDFSRYQRVAAMTIGSYKNQLPVAANDVFTYELGTEPRLNVTTNDYDPENKGLRVIVRSWPQYGDLTIESSTSIKYTPDAGMTENFTDTFTYNVFDGTNYSELATVELRFAKLLANDDLVFVSWPDSGTSNAAPTKKSLVASKGPIIQHGDLPNESKSIQINLLGNDIVTSSQYSVILASAPSGGSVGASVNGSIPMSGGMATYTYSSSDAFVYDTFDYWIEKPDGERSNKARAVVSNLPVPINDAYAVSSESSTALDIMLNDQLNDFVRYNVRPVVVSQPGNGRATEHFDGGIWRIIYQPDPVNGIGNGITFKNYLETLDVGINYARSVVDATVTLNVGPTPDALTGFNVVRSSADSITVNWNASPDANDSHQLEQLFTTGPADLSTSERDWVAASIGTRDTSHTYYSLQDGYYHYRARACSQLGMCGPWQTSTQQIVANPTDEIGRAHV